MQAISLCLCKQCLYISLLLRAIFFYTFFCKCQSFHLSVFVIIFRMIKFYLSAYLLFYSAIITAYSPLVSSFFIDNF